MRIPTLGETDLLVPLHEGLLEQPLWSAFLARLRSATGAKSVAFVLEGSGEAILLEAGQALSAATRGALHDISRGLRYDRVYAREDLADPPGDLPVGVRVIRVKGEDGIAATLALFAQEPFEARIAGLLAALVPHLRVALRAFAALERERSRSAVSEGVAARMNFGWITLDRQCRIVDCNAGAEHLLAASGLLRRGAYDRLVPAAPSLDRQLARLVADCESDPQARPRALNLGHDPWIDLLVSPVRLAGLGTSGRAVAVIYLRGDRTSEADRRDQLGDLFQLTPAEARVAWSMAQGLSIAETAKEHGLTIETARYYSKKIYAKTGSRGQSDLVRNILTGVLALA